MNQQSGWGRFVGPVRTRKVNQGKPRSQKNPKHQIPKLRGLDPCHSWNLELEFWSFFGAWCLELFLGGNFALHPGSGVLGELARVFQIELTLNLLAIIFDRFDAQMQFVGDVARLFPLADELKDFQFTVTEYFDRRLIDVRLSADLLLQNLGGEAVADINGAAQHSPNSSQNLLQRLLLHHVTQRPGPQSNSGIDGFV